MIRCDGCGMTAAEADEDGPVFYPPGWHSFSVKFYRASSGDRNAEYRIDVCPGCWAGKTAADVLGKRARV